MKSAWEVYTPKDYAEWLVDEYKKILINNEGNEEIKKCVLVNLESTRNLLRLLVGHYIKTHGVKAYIDICFSKDLTITYLDEVKKHIEKL